MESPYLDIFSLDFFYRKLKTLIPVGFESSTSKSVAHLLFACLTDWWYLPYGLLTNCPFFEIHKHRNNICYIMLIPSTYAAPEVRSAIAWYYTMFSRCLWIVVFKSTGLTSSNYLRIFNSISQIKIFFTFFQEHVFVVPSAAQLDCYSPHSPTQITNLETTTDQKGNESGATFALL